MKTILYFATVTSLLSLSCTKNNVHPSDSSLTDYFPNKVGEQWVYKVTDSLKNITDTVTVTITGKMNDPITGETFMIWQYKWPDKLDTTYVENKGDTIRCYINPNQDYSGGYFPEAYWTGMNLKEVNIYIMPFNLNKVIFSPYGEGFGSVITAIIPSGFIYANLNGNEQVDSIYEIGKALIYPNTYLKINEYFAPHIGMLKKHFIEIEFGATTISEYWELISTNFSVKTVISNTK